jgi:ketosteroid isomerase-like protein
VLTSVYSAYPETVDTWLVSSANLELVRAIYANWERGDWSSVEWADPEIEFVIPDGAARGSWTGLAGMAEGWRGWLGAWKDYGVTVDEFRELDEERVLVLVHQRGRGKASGLEIGQMSAKGASLFHVRDGKVTRLIFHIDRERAFADLGLEE